MFPKTLSAFKVYGNNEGCLSAGVSLKSDLSMLLTPMATTITFGGSSPFTTYSDSSCDVSTAEIQNASLIYPQ